MRNEVIALLSLKRLYIAVAKSRETRRRNLPISISRARGIIDLIELIL